ncbi:bifunctional tetrahydrofolate synthase/dihydrofolate synthase [Aeromonas enteropelogenes]|uniref:Dihydrofolate synthase/folylpolyglutamate synthase n=1 Tax=Aeromonas enteropelogenes TaxID=29489 RepID=A0A175VKN2_AEREN|nr:bifunctional tetrahydrofolate synthase/dihydrofolate synthase [Aeromonas enteropelogenes]KXU81275.1 bifunctional folylpolyglutamate synthase/dihydrofolate synthase [Aeromonas enteropelogenes]UBH25977.1 bifunctional tetrahydrofolate synthase/dihydrofolate synthase [Aeromonas enteropelogenes]
MSSNMQQSQSRSLVDWLSYLEQIHPVNIDMGLDRVGLVARRMELTELPFKVITVAGTNGKGSSCAMAASILMAAGHKVGVYSSPHLLRFTERVRINGEELADNDHCAAFAEVEAARGETALTFFEFATLAGLWLFRRAAPDVLLLEVGLGGRLDATNVVESDVALITSIALDHCDWLGDTREAVAVEKAGVYRAGKPAISGEPNPPATIASEALRIGANLRQVGIDFRGDEHDSGWDYHGLNHWCDLPKPALPLMNAVTVLAALESLGLPLPESAIREGLANARLAGRMQRLQTAPLVIVDVAHNPHSAAYLASQLRQIPCKGVRRAVVGMLKDKDMAGSLAELDGLIDEWHLASLTGPRAASATQLRDALGEGRGPAQTHDAVVDAYRTALAASSPDDMVIVFGSFYTVADILAQVPR